jgi:hypothetical protein
MKAYRGMEIHNVFIAPSIDTAAHPFQGLYPRGRKLGEPEGRFGSGGEEIF